MSAAPRITRPGVRVDVRGRWFYGADEITNAGVLAYFRRNLHRESGGAYYIANQFGELLEHGYLDAVLGFPLGVLRATPAKSDGVACLELQLDSGELMNAPASAMALYADDCLAVRLPERNLIARLSPLAMAGLADSLSEGPDGYELRLDDARPPTRLHAGDLEELRHSFADV